MKIPCKCQSCGFSGTVDAALLGKQVACPKCKCWMPTQLLEVLPTQPSATPRRGLGDELKEQPAGWLGIASLIIGVFSALLIFIPCIYFLALPCGGVGVICAILCFCLKSGPAGKGFALGGIILSAGAMILGGIGALMLMNALDKIGNHPRR